MESAFRTQLALGKIGIKPKPKAPTLKEAVNDFLKGVKVSRAQSTYKRIEYSFEPRLRFFGESIRLTGLRKKIFRNLFSPDKLKLREKQKRKSPAKQSTENYAA